MIRIETAEFIHEYFHRKNSSLTVRFILYNATRAQIKCNTFPAVLLSRGGDSHMKPTGMLVGNFEFNP